MAFMAKRCRRIFPGLVVCCFLMVYIIEALFTKASALDYFFANRCAHFSCLRPWAAGQSLRFFRISYSRMRSTVVFGHCRLSLTATW